MRPDLLQRLALIGRRRYRAIFVVTAVLVAVSVGLAARLRLDSDVLALLPRDEPAVSDLRQALEEFGSLDFLLVVVRLPEGAVLDPYLSLADDLGGRLERLDSLAQVDYRIGELEELVAGFLPEAVLLLDERGREAMLARLSDSALAQRAREIRRLLATPQSLALKSLVKLDPLGIAPVFMDRLAASRAGLAVDWTSGYLLSPDHRLLLLLAKPVAPPQDVEFARGMVAAVNSAVEAARAGWPAIAGEGGPPAPHIDLAGRYLVALADDATIRRDVVVNIASSLAGVMILFLLAFGRFGPLLYALVPLGAGLAVTFGLAQVAFGTLSVATSGVAALLIGLGIDLVIVSYGRYVEERRAGAGLADALVTMNGSNGRAVMLAATTTAATFFAFGVTEFTGLRQMGYLTGCGILACLLAVFVLLPAMLAFHDDRQRLRQALPRLVLHGFGAARLIRFSLARPWPVLVAALVLTATLAVFATRVHFEDSVQAMRPPDAASVALRDEVARSFGGGFDAMMLVIHGRTLDETLTRVERAARGAAELVAEGVLAGVDAATGIVPSPARQSEALAWLAAQHASGRLDLARVRQRFEAELTAAGLRAEPFGAGLDLMQRALAEREPLDLADFERTAAGRQILQRYLHATLDGGFKSVVYLYPRALQWRREPPPQAVALAASLGPDAVLTGANVVSQVLRRQVLRDAWVAGSLGFALVTALLWLDYRQWQPVLLSLAPLLAGLTWMVGGMGLAGVSMNFMNVFVATMIIGIGVDYGVHMVHRYRELRDASPARLEEGLVETGKAIVMAALTTVVGFGSLSTSHYPGLRSMGQVAVLGALSTCLAAITLLPAYIAVAAKRRR